MVVRLVQNVPRYEPMLNYDGALTYAQRVEIPETLHTKILNEFHPGRGKP